MQIQTLLGHFQTRSSFFIFLPYVLYVSTFFTVLEFPYSHGNVNKSATNFDKNLFSFSSLPLFLLISSRPVWRDSTTTLFIYSYSCMVPKLFKAVRSGSHHSKVTVHEVGIWWGLPTSVTEQRHLRASYVSDFLLHLSLSINFRWPYIAYRFYVKKRKRILFWAPLSCSFAPFTIQFIPTHYSTIIPEYSKRTHHYSLPLPLNQITRIQVKNHAIDKNRERSKQDIWKNKKC